MLRFFSCGDIMIDDAIARVPRKPRVRKDTELVSFTCRENKTVNVTLSPFMRKPAVLLI